MVLVIIICIAIVFVLIWGIIRSNKANKKEEIPSTTAKDIKQKKGVIDILGIDISNYPDSTFLDRTEVFSKVDNIDYEKVYIKFFDKSEKRAFGIFKQVRLIKVNSTTFDYEFQCVIDSIKSSDLKNLINSIYQLYGEDNYGGGAFVDGDWSCVYYDDEWVEGYMGRYWNRTKYPNNCKIQFNDMGYLQLIIEDVKEKNELSPNTMDE